MFEAKLTWHSSHRPSLSQGERAADIVRNGMGSWRFVASFLVFMALWTLINAWNRDPWDPIPLSS
jgi:uncharacterized membrane protein